MTSTIRNTFGTCYAGSNRKYPDIISAHLELRKLSLYSIYEPIHESKDRQKPYTILIDQELALALDLNKEVNCIISFQVRTTGCYAVARIFKSKNEMEQIK